MDKNVKFTKGFSSPIEIEIAKELNKYQEAKEADVEFHILKAIKLRIKLLHIALGESRKSSNRKLA